MLSHTQRHLFELFRSECASAGSIKGFKDGLEGRFVVCLAIESEYLEEGGKVHISFMSCIVHNGKYLAGLAFKIESNNSIDELFRGNIPTAICVKDVKNFLQFDHSLGIELWSDIL